MNEFINFSSLRNDSDIRLAREKLKYSIRLQEEVMMNNVGNLRKSFVLSLRQSFFKMGSKWVAIAAVNLLRRKRRK